MNITIIQDNSRVEVLGSNGASIIEKLYELAIDPNNTLTLEGNISSTAAYGYQVDYLNTNYGPDFIVSATNRYIRFQDSEVFNVLMSNNIGDGTGITQQVAASVSSLGTMFRNNTSITSFNELSYFTNVTTLAGSGPYYGIQGAFQNCTSLESIDLSNIQVIDGNTFSECTSLRTVGNFQGTALGVDLRSEGAFCNCSSLESIDLSNVDFIPVKAFRDCRSLSNVGSLEQLKGVGMAGFRNCELLSIDLNLPNLIERTDTYHPYMLGGGAFMGTGILSVQNLGQIQEIRGDDYYDGQSHSGAFANCRNLRYAILPSTVNKIGVSAFYGCTALEYIKCQATTPPTLGQTDSARDNFPFYNTTCIIYVPDSSVSAYKSAAGWSNISNRIKSINSFSTDFPNG